MGRACVTHGEEEKCVQGFSGGEGKPEEKLDVHKRIRFSFFLMFQLDDTFFVQNFISCKRLYMLRVKHLPIIRKELK
jgi:hypothetical protein